MPDLEEKPLRRHWRYSLLTLLLATGLTMTVLSHVLTSLELRRLRMQSDELRVTDRTKLYARLMGVSTRAISRYRVFLPEGHTFYLHLATKDIAAIPSPIPEQSDKIHENGEMVVDVFEDYDPGGAPGRAYRITYTSFDGFGQSTRTALRVDLSPTIEIGVTRHAAAKKVQIKTTDEPLILYEAAKDAHGWYMSPSPPQAGIAIWIDNKPPPEGANGARTD